MEALMKNDIFLKKSFFGGFNKAETLIYIDEMQAMLEKTRKEKDNLTQNMKTSTDNLDNQNQDFSKQIEQMNIQIEELNEKIKILTSQNSDLNLKINDLTADKDNLTTRNNDLTTSINNLTASNQTSDNQLNLLTSQNDELRYENERLSNKLKKYESMKESIVSQEVDAKIRAKEIISTSERDAKQVLDTAHIKNSKLTQEYRTDMISNMDEISELYNSIFALTSELAKKEAIINNSMNKFRETLDKNCSSDKIISLSKNTNLEENPSSENTTIPDTNEIFKYI